MPLANSTVTSTQNMTFQWGGREGGTKGERQCLKQLKNRCQSQAGRNVTFTFQDHCDANY